MTLRPNNPGKDLRARYAWLGAAFVVGLLVLAGRLYRLQVTHAAEYQHKSEANFIKEIPIPADRGMIMDAHGRILVDNRPSFDAFVTPAFCARCEEGVLPRLAGWLGWDEEELARMQALVKQKGRTSERFQRVPVRVDLTRDEMDILLSHQRELEGLDVEPVPHRSYRAGAVLSHVLGYMNEITQAELEQKVPGRPEYHLGDYVGRRGIERALEEYLRGRDGMRKEVVDAHGRVFKGLAQQLGMETVRPEPGYDVITTLDYRLQEVAEQAFPGVA
ncbi:MAG: penicillin-binding protein 2, partial [Deltaproteobacteria bacterium]|nr:penicillin-binding protein 2 [Deltaproteobacteria bacterium]